MDSSTSFSRNHTLPENFRFLCMLHNIGAHASDKSLPVEEISKWTMMEKSTIESHLKKSIELGYVQFVRQEEGDKYYLTPDGIRKVLTLYS